MENKDIIIIILIIIIFYLIICKKNINDSFSTRDSSNIDELKKEIIEESFKKVKQKVSEKVTITESIKNLGLISRKILKNIGGDDELYIPGTLKVNKLRITNQDGTQTYILKLDDDMNLTITSTTEGNIILNETISKLYTSNLSVTDDIKFGDSPSEKGYAKKSFDSGTRINAKKIRTPTLNTNNINSTKITTGCLYATTLKTDFINTHTNNNIYIKSPLNINKEFCVNNNDHGIKFMDGDGIQYGHINIHKHNNNEIKFALHGRGGKKLALYHQTD